MPILHAETQPSVVKQCKVTIYCFSRICFFLKTRKCGAFASPSVITRAVFIWDWMGTIIAGIGERDCDSVEWDVGIR